MSESTAYEVYGKAFFLVYLLMMPIARYVHAMHLERSGTNWEPRTWRVLWFALVLACVGDAVSYWGISAPGAAGDALWGFGFLIEILAGIVVLFATTAYGVISHRLRVIPRWASWLLMAVIPIGVLTLVTITTYAPNALIVPLSLIWASIGAWVLLRSRESSGLRPVAGSAA